jgi:hypothetical protein
MNTYQFTAFQNQRYAANGEVKADSPEEAKAKILQRYNSLWQGLDFDDYVEDEAPDHFILTDEAGEEYHLEDETPPDVLTTLTALIEKDEPITNKTRAHRAEIALQNYVQEKGEVYEESSSEIADLIADLLHLTASLDEGEDAVESTLRLARMHFDAEQQEEMLAAGGAL